MRRRRRRRLLYLLILVYNLFLFILSFKIFHRRLLFFLHRYFSHLHRIKRFRLFQLFTFSIETFTLLSIYLRSEL